MSPTTTVPATGLRPAGTSLARITASRVVVELKAFFREKDQVIWTFSFPAILMLIFGTVFDQDIGGGVSFPQYFLAGMVAIVVHNLRIKHLLVEANESIHVPRQEGDVVDPV